MLMLFEKSFYWGKSPRGHFIRVSLQRITSYQSLTSQFKRKKIYYWEYEIVWRVFNYALFIWVDGDNYGF